MLGFEHAPKAHLTTGLHAGIRPQQPHAVRGNCLDIAHGSRVQPHLAIHGGGDPQGTRSGHAQCGQKVIRTSLGKPRDEIGGGRCHQNEVTHARELDMPHAIGDTLVPHVDMHPIAGECLKARRRHEALGAGRHHDGELGAEPNQQTSKHRRLVGRNAPGNAQQDPLA